MINLVFLYMVEHPLVIVFFNQTQTGKYADQVSDRLHIKRDFTICIPTENQKAWRTVKIVSAFIEATSIIIHWMNVPDDKYKEYPTPEAAKADSRNSFADGYEVQVKDGKSNRIYYEIKIRRSK